MERIGRSWGLVKASWGVLRSDKELVLYPIVSSVLSVIVLALFAIPVVATGGLSRWSDGDFTVVDAILLFLFYLVTYTVVIFSNCALVGAANIRLDGGDPTLGDGFRIALSRLPQIVAWAVVSATVGVILRFISERAGFLGTIAASIIGVAWSIATFMVVPILVVEGVGPIAALKRSGGLLRQTWGEQIVGNISIGLVMGLVVVAVMLLGGFASAALFALSPVLGIVAFVILVIVVVVLGLISAALSGIFTIALYRYATGRGASAFFDQSTMQGAFAAKR